MNAMHLFWIVPLALAVGAFMACVLIGGKK